MKAIWAIARKDLLILFRDKGDVFFTFVFPLLMALLFGMVFGGKGGRSKIQIALAVESKANLAESLAEDLVADESFKVTRYGSREEAIDKVRSGKASAAVILPTTLVDGLDAIFSGKGIPVEAVVDPARQAESGLIQGKLNELAFRQLPKLFTDKKQFSQSLDAIRGKIQAAAGIDQPQKDALGKIFDSLRDWLKLDELPKAAEKEEVKFKGAGFSPISVKVEELPPKAGDPTTSFDVTFPQGVVWGLAGCVMAFSSSIVTEKARGTLDRLRLAPIGWMHLLSGKGLACFIVALLVQILLVGLAVLGFGSRIRQPVPLGLAMILVSFAFSGLAILLAGLAKTESQAHGAGRAVVLVLALIGGGTIPLFFMPPLLQTVSLISPFRWAVYALEGPFWRDLALSEQLIPLGVLALIGVVGWAIGVAGLSGRITRS